MSNGIDIPLQIALGPFVQAMQQAAKSVVDFQAAVSATEARMTSVERSTRTMAQGLAGIMDRLQDDWNRATLGGTQYRIEQIRKEARETERAIRESTATREEVESALARNAQVTEVRITAALREEAAKRNALAQQEASQRQATLNRVAIAAGITFAAMSGTAVIAAKRFGDFEAVLNRISAVSGAGAAELERLKQASVKIGSDTQFSTQQAAEGFLELAKAGLTVNEQMAAMPGVVAAASAAGTSLGQAAETVGGAVRGFGLEMSAATRVADLLAKAANVSAIDVSDVAEAFKYVAPVAKASNQSIEGISAALVILGNNLIKGSEAGTGLRSILVHLQAPSNDAAKTLKRIGLDVQDSAGRMKSLGQLLEELAQKTAKFNQIGQSRIFESIFGTEAISAVSALVNEIRKTPTAFAEAEKAMKSVDGAAGEMASKMRRGLKASLDELGGSVETAAQSFGEKLAPAIQAASKWLNGLVDSFNSASSTVKGAIAILLGTGLAGAGSVAILAGLGEKLQHLRQGVDALKAAAIGLASAVQLQLYAAVIRFIAGFNLAQLAGAGAFRAILAGIGSVLGPIGLAIAAVGTLAAILYQLKAANDQEAAAEQRLSQARLDHVLALSKLTTQQAAGVTQTKALATELEALAQKKNRTTAETRRLYEVSEQLKKLNPGLRSTIDAVANGHAAAIVVINAKAAAYDRVRAAAIRAARAELAEAQVRVFDLRAKLRSARADVAEAGQLTPADVRFGTEVIRDHRVSRAKQASAAVDAELKSAESDQKRLRSLYDGLTKTADGAAITSAKAPAPAGGGAAFGGGSGLNHGDQADHAAKEAFDALKQRRQTDIEDAKRHRDETIRLFQEAFRDGKVTAIELFQARVMASEEAKDRIIADLEAIKKATKDPGERASIDKQIAASKGEASKEQLEAERDVARELQAIDDATRRHAIDAAKEASRQAIEAKRAEFEQGRVSFAEFSAFRRQETRVTDKLELGFLQDQAKRFKEGTRQRIDAEAAVTREQQRQQAQRAEFERETRKAATAFGEQLRKGAQERSRQAIEAEEAELEIALQKSAIALWDYYDKKDQLEERSHQLVLDDLDAQILAAGENIDKLLELFDKRDAEIARRAQQRRQAIEKAKIEVPKAEADQVLQVTAAVQGLAGTVGKLGDAFRETNPLMAEAFDGLDTVVSVAVSPFQVLAQVMKGDFAAAAQTVVKALIDIGTNMTLNDRLADAYRQRMEKLGIAFDEATTKLRLGSNQAASQIFSLGDELFGKVGEFGQGTAGEGDIKARMEALAAQLGVPKEAIQEAVQRIQRVKQLQDELARTVRAEGDVFQIGGTDLETGAWEFFAFDGDKKKAFFERQRSFLRKQIRGLQGDLEAFLNSPTFTQAIPDSERAKDSNDRQAEAFKDIEGVLRARAEAEVEYERGALNKRGERVSFERKLEEDLEDLRQEKAEADARRSERRQRLIEDNAKAEQRELEQVRKLQDEILTSFADQQAEVDKIRFEGVLEKQQSVEEDKRNRIEEVREKFDKLRQEKQADIDRIKDAAAERRQSHEEALRELDEEALKAQANHDNQVARLRNEYQERLTLHNLKLKQYDEEINKLDEIAKLGEEFLKTVLETEKAKARAYTTTASGGGGGGGGGGGSYAPAPSGSSSTGLTTGSGEPVYRASFGTYTPSAIPALQAAGLLPKKHEGGIIDLPALGFPGLGPDEVPIVAQAGEAVLPRDLTQLLLTAAGRAPSQSPSAPIYSITVQVENLNGADRATARRLADMVLDELSARQRRRGNYGNL